MTNSAWQLVGSIYYWEHEVLHTLVILNPSAALRINSVEDILI